MPRMDGLQLLRALREKHRFPVIFLTSKDEEIDEILGLSLGADDFIKKPFSQRLLLERIKAVLRRGEQPTEPISEEMKVMERGRPHISTRCATPVPGMAGP